MANQPQVWSPLKELDRFRRDFDDLFDRFLGGRAGPLFARAGDYPPLESFIDNGELVIRADLPGVDPKDVEITVAGDTLTIRATREQQREEKTRNYIHREVSYGSIERSLQLPEGVNPDEIKASYRNGVLELTAPVPREVSARKVPIEIERK
ncbi:MAG TPA: Hsp20/alpha crystallin family protein [Candidatus Binataceae bacterium]|jgi:HSP20 family protein|nr:Hsp20/alpha crystallin family protein [Candidatus Binataceae bacterium]